MRSHCPALLTVQGILLIEHNEVAWGSRTPMNAAIGSVGHNTASTSSDLAAMHVHNRFHYNQGTITERSYTLMRCIKYVQYRLPRTSHQVTPFCGHKL